MDDIVITTMDQLNGRELYVWTEVPASGDGYLVNITMQGAENMLDAASEMELVLMAEPCGNDILNLYFAYGD